MCIYICLYTYIYNLAFYNFYVPLQKAYILTQVTVLLSDIYSEATYIDKRHNLLNNIMC